MPCGITVPEPAGLGPEAAVALARRQQLKQLKVGVTGGSDDPTAFADTPSRVYILQGGELASTDALGCPHSLAENRHHKPEWTQYETPQQTQSLEKDPWNSIASFPMASKKLA